MHISFLIKLTILVFLPGSSYVKEFKNIFHDFLMRNHFRIVSIKCKKFKTVEKGKN